MDSNFGCGGVDIDFVNGNVFFAGLGGPAVTRNNNDTDAWYVKPFWRKVWGSMNGVGLGSLGATTFFGEWGQYNDQFNAGKNFCSTAALGFGAGNDVGNFCLANVVQLNGDDDSNSFAGTGGVFVNHSTVERWGLGVVQEIELGSHACLGQMAASAARCHLYWLCTRQCSRMLRRRRRGVQCRARPS